MFPGWLIQPPWNVPEGLEGVEEDLTYQGSEKTCSKEEVMNVGLQR